MGSPDVSYETFWREMNKSEGGFQQYNDPKHEFHHINGWFSW